MRSKQFVPENAKKGGKVCEAAACCVEKWERLKSGYGGEARGLAAIF